MRKYLSVAAVLFLSSSPLALAQRVAPPVAPPKTMAPPTVHGPGCEMQPEHMAQLYGILHARLSITPEQDPAWTVFTKAITADVAPLAAQCAHPVDFGTITLPQRLAYDTARQHELSVVFPKIQEDTRKMYAQLSPSQQAMADRMVPGARRAPPAVLPPSATP